MMQRTPVESSNLADAGFDADSGTMEVTFHNGRRYRYHGITPEKFEAFMAAESKGRYFNAEIKGQHEAEPVDAGK